MQKKYAIRIEPIDNESPSCLTYGDIYGSLCDASMIDNIALFNSRESCVEIIEQLINTDPNNASIVSPVLLDI